MLFSHDHVILSGAKNLCPSHKDSHKDSNAVEETLRQKAAQGDMALGFGGLVRVMNKRQEFLWVHEKFAGEY